MTVPVRHFSGLVYRAHHPMWAFQPLSGEGAKKFGGRFNRAGSAALYTSLDLTTAWMEAQQGFPFKPQPMTMVAYRVDCADIAGILVRSFAPGCMEDSRNLVLWECSHAEPHAIQIIDDQDRLPRTQDSWG